MRGFRPGGRVARDAAAYLRDKYGLEGRLVSVSGGRRTETARFRVPDLARVVSVRAEFFGDGDFVLSDDVLSVRFERDAAVLADGVLGAYFDDRRVFPAFSGMCETLDADVWFAGYALSRAEPFRLLAALPASGWSPTGLALAARDLAVHFPRLDLRAVVLRDEMFLSCDERSLGWSVLGRGFVCLADVRVHDSRVRVRFQSGGVLS